MTKIDELHSSLCGDHSCIFGRVPGMGTNGGCRCLKDIRNAVRRIQIERRVRALRKALKETQG